MFYVVMFMFFMLGFESVIITCLLLICIYQELLLQLMHISFYGYIILCHLVVLECLSEMPDKIFPFYLMKYLFLS